MELDEGEKLEQTWFYISSNIVFWLVPSYVYYAGLTEDFCDFVRLNLFPLICSQT